MPATRTKEMLMTNKEGIIKLGHAPFVTIQVTEEIIANAVRSNSAHCVVADAITAYFREHRPEAAAYVAADLQTVRFTNRAKGERYTYLTPRKCQVAIVDWDQGRTPAPFTFTLRDGQTSVAGHTTAENAQRRVSRAKRTLENKMAEKIDIAHLMEKENASADTTKVRSKAVLRSAKGGSRTVPVRSGGRV